MRCPRRCGRAISQARSPSSTPPMRARSRPRTQATRWRGRSNCSPASPATKPAARAPPARTMLVAHAGDRRRQPAQFRRARRADAQGQRRHRHRRDRSRGDAGRTHAPDRRPSPHARPARDRRRDLRRRPAADVLQRRLSRAVGPRRRLPRPEPDRFRRARPAARGAQAARAAGLPRLEGRPARSLSRPRGARACLAPARRPHAARRHHAQPAGRRDLSVRRRHRAARPGAPLRCADPRAGRDARQPRRGGRGVRQRRPPAAAQSGVRATCGGSNRWRSPTGRTSRR